MNPRQNNENGPKGKASDALDQYPLAPYRVLDLTDPRGHLCGSTLAGLGGDVIKVEPIGGDSGRKIGPFYGDVEDREKSLFWAAFNCSKRSITLNIEVEPGKEIFKNLVKSADFVTESYAPGYLESQGLGYDDLRKINPGIILTSITPFGYYGPHASYNGAEIVCWARSGYMTLNGDPERAPLRFTFPQAYYHACLDSVEGTLIALWHRQLTGEGQHVDASAQESVAWESLNSSQSLDLNGYILKREGGFRDYGHYKFRYAYPCKDGYVLYHLLGGQIGAKGQRRLVQWMAEEGYSNDFLNNYDWDSLTLSTYDDEIARKLEGMFEPFFRTKTKAELLEKAVEMVFILAPMNNVEDMLASPQFRARDFFVQVEYPQMDDARLAYPGAPYKSDQMPWKMPSRAPTLGEHNRDIYTGELGYSEERVAELERSRVI